MYAQLEDYIEGSDYLSERRGQYAEQNRSRAPFSSVFDLKLLQDFYITAANGRRHTLQLSLDIFNVSNLMAAGLIRAGANVTSSEPATTAIPLSYCSLRGLSTKREALPVGPYTLQRTG